jgi:hypothetical protein
VAWKPDFARAIIPLQLCQTVIDSVRDLLPPSKLSAVWRILPPITPGGDVEPDGVWLSSVKAWFPGSWTDAVIADRAMKSDDVLMDTGPLNKRITLGSSVSLICLGSI